MSYFEYITVLDIRNEGVSDTDYTDARVLECIRQASAKVNLYTDQWFQPVVGIYYLDGGDSPFLRFPEFKKFIEVSSIEILDSRTSRIKSKVFPTRRYFDETTNIYQISNCGRFIEFVTDVSGLTSSGNFDTGCKYLWPLGRQNIKVDGVFGWLEEKYLEATVTSAATAGDTSVEVDSVENWEVGDYAVFYLDPANNVVDIQIVTGVDSGTNTLSFEGDGTSGGIRFDVPLSTEIKTFGRVPLLIQYVTKRFTIKLLESLSSVLDPENIINNAIVSEKVDNYTYKLNASVITSSSGIDSLSQGGTGDSTADSILQRFVTQVPPVVGYI